MGKILVVDDEPQVRTVIRRILEKEGFEVDMAENGVKALELCQASPYDLVITDIIMPEKEGLETMIDLRRHCPQTKIIAMSGGGRMSSEDCLRMAEGLGASFSFRKPIETKKFIEAVTSLLGDG